MRLHDYIILRVVFTLENKVIKTLELIEPMKKAGYKIEPFGSEDTTCVVEVPVDVGEGIRTVGELSIWEQFS